MEDCADIINFLSNESDEFRKVLKNGTPSLEELAKMVKERSQFYREENKRLQESLTRLKLLNAEIKFPHTIQNPLESIANIAIENDCDNTDTNTLSLAEENKRRRKQSNYLSKYKICIKLYMHLNEKLNKEIKRTQTDLNQSQSSIDSILTLSEQELKQAEEKVKRYENELLKFEKKYPWLKNPEFNLPHIQKEMDTLSFLRTEKNNLMGMLDCYKGLKPDLSEASKQLADIKLEYQRVSNKLLDSYQN